MIGTDSSCGGLVDGADGLEVFRRLGGQSGDLDQVVGQHPVSGPGPGTQRVQAWAVPPVSAFADPACAAGSPCQGSAERSPLFDSFARRAGFALPRDDDVGNPAVGQLLVDAGLAVATVGGHRPRHPAGALGDPIDRRRQLWCIGAGCPIRRYGPARCRPDCRQPDPRKANSTSLPSRPLAIGLAWVQCRLTTRVEPSGVRPANRTRV